MKHKIKVRIPVEKRGFWGKKTVYKTRTVWVDNKTYREIKKAGRNRPYTFEEMFLYDEIIGE